MKQQWMASRQQRPECRGLPGWLTILLLIAVLYIQRTCDGAQPAWALRGWQYRVPVQVHNHQDTPRESLRLALNDFPFLMLMSERKLAGDGRDLRLLDEQGSPVPLRVESPSSDIGDARGVILLEALPPRSRRILWLYYGNALALPMSARVDPGAPVVPPEEVTVSVGAEESRDPAPPVRSDALHGWSLAHRLIEAETGRGDGFSLQQAGTATAPCTSGGRFMFSGEGDGDTLSLSVVVPAGHSTIWMRYSPALPGYAPRGAATATVARGTVELLRLKQSFVTPGGHLPAPNLNQANPGYRWLALPITVTTAANVALQIRTQDAHLAIDCFVVTQDEAYRPDIRDFQGRVWARWRIDAPAEYRYWGKIHYEFDPGQAKAIPDDRVSRFGLLPGGRTLPFTEPADYMPAGQYSAWIQLPVSDANPGHAVFAFMPPSGKPPAGLTVRLEFANRPSPAHVFHVAPAEPLELESATAGVRLPAGTALSALARVELFTEWARRRLALLGRLHLPPPPRLRKLLVGSWLDLATHSGGTVTPEAAEIDFRIAEALGLNSITAAGVSDTTLAAAMKAHGFINASWPARADAWRDTVAARDHAYDFTAGETPEQHWRRVFADYYGNLADQAKTRAPLLSSVARHIDLGGTIQPAASIAEIRATPQLLSCFRAWLQAQGLAPALFGAAVWDDVLPVDDRARLDENENAVYARLFFYSQQFVTHYAALYYGAATEQARAAFPHGEFVGAGVPTGLLSFGFLGNIADAKASAIDLLQLTRMQALQGIMLEDRGTGSDLDIGRLAFGAEMLRAAARKHSLPMAACLVGGDAIRARSFACLMHGITETNLYLYGPLGDRASAWAEQEQAWRETADSTRLVKIFEDAIAAGALRPRKAAMLIAGASDIMQKQGLYFGPERQALYLALKHSCLEVDLISESEVVDDGILRQYSLLYLSDPQLRAETQSMIADWVASGGRLWAEVGAASWDESNQPCALLDPVFGVARREMVVQQNWLPPAAPPGGGAVSQFAYQQVGVLKTSSDLFGPDIELPVWGARLDCTPTTAQVRGIYEDGAPAILLNRYGTGQALLVGALVGEAYQRMHYPDGAKSCGRTGWRFEFGAPALRLVGGLLKSAGIVRSLELSVPGIYSSVMDCPQGTLVFLDNATLATATAPASALKPVVTVRVRDTGVSSVESARLGKIPFIGRQGVVSFAIALPNADVILLRH